MDLGAAVRLALVYSHLLLSVFALHLVLSTDLRVLRQRIGAGTLLRIHRRVSWLLAGLWISGLAIVAIDFGGHFAEMAQQPKLLVKLLCVSVLTLNALLLRGWCFARLVAGRVLGRAEIGVLMTCGAISTSGWLGAAFFGVAKPLQQLSLQVNLSLYGAGVVLAIGVALLIGPRLHSRLPRSGSTALEEAAETLDLRLD